MFFRKKIPEHKEPNQYDIIEMQMHIPVFLLRGSTWSLKNFIDLYERKDNARKFIISIKYDLSKCRPEILNIFSTMASRPRTFKLELDSTGYAKYYTLHDTMTNMRFRTRTSSHGTPRLVRCDGVEMFDIHESEMFVLLCESLNHLQERHDEIERQKYNNTKQRKVFNIYAGNKSDE